MITPPPFSPDELARYSRQLLLPGVGLDGQAKLRHARVLVLGLGGLGSPVSLYLAAAGVGTLGLAEFDRVEIHNLHRQILHSTPSVGSSKLASARARLADLNPRVTLREHADGLTPANALQVFSRYDLVVDGADNFPTRYLASDTATRTARPLIHGSLHQFEGQVTVLDPAQGAPCYRCLFPEMPAPGDVPNCAEAGVFGALCGVIGSLMALEALKVILKIGEPLRGRLLAYDALAPNPTRLVHIKRDPECPCCGPQPDPRIASLDASLYPSTCAIEPASPARKKSSDTNERFLRDLRSLQAPAPPSSPSSPPDPLLPPLEVDPHSARAWLESDQPPLILDIREPFETAICSFPNALAIPLAQLPVRLDHLPTDRPILVHCHHGARSLQVAQFLRARGFHRVASLRGGINQWAELFEPHMPRY